MEKQAQEKNKRERKEDTMINRLLGIIYILISKGTVTATELAERFDVTEEFVKKLSEIPQICPQFHLLCFSRRI